MLKTEIFSLLKKALERENLPADELSLTSSVRDNFGDYSTSIALSLAKSQKKDPLTLAQQIVDAIPAQDCIEKIEVQKPGFINIWISAHALLANLSDMSQNSFSIPEYHLGLQKKCIVEYAHPNTHKLFHIGHLRNITTGESISRLLKSTGNSVINVNYQGDVGLHIAKTLWAAPKLISELGEKKVASLPLRDKIKLLGDSYVAGSSAYEENEKAQKEIIEINKQIYNQDGRIMPLYQRTRDWSLEYFEERYARVDTTFDKKYFESEMAPRSLELIDELLKKQILENSEGAVIFNGEGQGVHTRVFLNKEGYPTYEGKELPLAEKETTDFGKVDKIIHVVTGEQTSFFQTTFKVEELTDKKRYAGIQHHLVYGWVHLKGGKMSSRKGNVIEGDWLLDEAKKQIMTSYHSSDDVAETLAVAAVKYSFLKTNLQGDVYFDIADATTLQGDSGPYLIYTYVRCKSVLAKGGEVKRDASKDNKEISLSEEERIMLRILGKYGETVHDATKSFAPNYLCSYLYDLAQKYNGFYQKCPILSEPDQKTKEVRIAITQATAHTIAHGLRLLGIKTVEKM